MKIALLQSDPCHDLGLCAERLDAHLSAAKAQGAEMLVTPEMWMGGYNIPPDVVRRNASEFANLTDQIARIIARHGIPTIIGCAAPAEPAPLNTALAFDGSGQQVAHYAKCHLYGSLDAARFTPGAALSPVFEFAGLRVGMAICYDIEFPETARSLALNGAQLILVPTANMTPYESVSRRLIPARAQENGVYIAYANLCGVEGDLSYCGLSCICAPDGETLAIGGSGPELIFADIEADQVTETQSAQPYLTDRRADIYRTD